MPADFDVNQLLYRRVASTSIGSYSNCYQREYECFGAESGRDFLKTTKLS